jgi:hypothetical protein
MGVQIAEMAGGLALLVIEGLAIWGLFELGSQIFLKIKTRQEKGGE